MTRPPLFFEVTAELAGHIAVAVNLYARDAKKHGLAVPAALADFVAAMSSRAMRGQDGSPVDELWQVAQATHTKPSRELLTVPEVAAVLNVSASTVKRRLAAGALTSIKDGGCRRVHVADLGRYLEKQGAKPC